MDDFINFLLFARDNDDNPPARGPKRYLRDPGNILDYLDDSQFFERYRFSKHTFLNEIYPLVRETVERPTKRGVVQTPIMRVLAVLHFYATGNFQISTGDAHGISQPTICRLIQDVSKALALHTRRYIYFPADLAVTKREFYRIARFPGVVGCIDCTHIPIQLPSTEGGENYRNRKGYFSINVQVVGGPNGQIFDIVARWPGSTHDSRIFQNSRVYGRFERRELVGLLLGDGGYAQTSFLYTPVLNPQAPAELRYNRSQIDTRNSVERLFGVWKRRFACLRRKLANKPTTISHIISACAVLHNIAINNREALPPPPESQEDDNVGTDDNHLSNRNIRGSVIRRDFIVRNFSD